MDSKLDQQDVKGTGPAAADSKGSQAGKGLIASIPGAIAALFLVAAMALGAAALLPDADGPGHDGKAIVIEPTQKADAAMVKDDVAVWAKGDETQDEAPKATAKPAPKATAKPAPKATETFSLAVGHVACGAKLSWGAYPGDGLDAYKVVRSDDDKVAWPLGAKDTLVGAVGPDGDRVAKDCEAPAGKSWYRVFAVRKTDGAYEVLGKSTVKAIVVERPDPTPVPDPVSLGLDVEATADGIVLHWEGCSSEDFVAYKIVRSQSNDDPTYPTNDGTQKAAGIGDAGTTTWTDSDVASGQTWFYRVYAIGSSGGETYVLGVTPVRSATAP